ncbi:contractile injection system tape measure protein [Aquimarina sp. D1M17]|uniref:contractile injection system tape measure protein n=1 Tax=Aquimarina acroporae TaxID=2937283 RepID=UPI0020BFC103|nr:contractile injection system tape measure protein [Aquimarina acroporae]MCK8521387.1 contractile injection system tape measure protein [Aquimarina acroporae]
MKINNLHRIQNASIEFDFDRLDEAMSKTNDLVDWIKENVLQLVDEHASKLSDRNTVTQIPELTIELNLTIEEDLLKESNSIYNLLSTQIQTAIEKSIQEHQSNTISKKEFNANIVLEYIKTGQLNHQYLNEEWEFLIGNFLQNLIKNRTSQFVLLNSVSNIDAFVRFFKLKDITVVKELIQARSQEKNIAQLIDATLKLFLLNVDYFLPTHQIDFYYKIFKELPRSNVSLVVVLQKIIREQVINDRISSKNLLVPKEIKNDFPELLIENIQEKEKDIRKRLEPKSDIGEHQTNSSKNTEFSSEVLDEGALIIQAGLVLLAPFIPRFLKILGYINEKGEIHQKNKLPILLHYLATGESMAPEWKLTLPKLLSGLRPGQHCDTELESTEDLDNQVNELLTSVISHWEALKTTSIEGLREAFLIREGKLKKKNGFYFLYVEEQTVDILLSYVPWNYSTIKLDWMSEILFVEWNKT